MKRVALALGLVAAGSAAAFAQQPPPAAIVEGSGVKVGEGTVLHPIVGVESGVIHNVFYEESQANISGLLRVIAELAFGSLPPERMQAPAEQLPNTRDYGDLALRGDFGLAYEEYLSSNDDIQSQRNLTGHAQLQGLVNPRRTWQFMFAEGLRRAHRPVNFESPNSVDRDINVLSLGLRFRPQGRTLSGSLTYTNTIDYFEAEAQQFANRMQHTLGLQVAWQWLPMTRVTGDISWGYFQPFTSESTRVPSFPLRIKAGIATSITVKTMANAYVGFGKGFYSEGPDFTNVIGGLQFAYRFSPQSRVALGYEYDFHDSINANFYRDHVFAARIEQQIDRFGIFAAAELRLREYRGIITEVMAPERDRNDLIFAIPISARYNFRDWIAATLDYQLITDQTDFRYIPQVGDPMDDPSYTQQQLLLGVRAAY
ncbi:MAG: hypothetical protein AB7T06_07430 [Kofleriaceae bacterium]